jgi:hypothetical protein
LIDGWHCLFLKLNKIDANLSGQSRNDCASNFRTSLTARELTLRLFAQRHPKNRNLA